MIINAFTAKSQLHNQQKEKFNSEACTILSPHLSHERLTMTKSSCHKFWTCSSLWKKMKKTKQNKTTSAVTSPCPSLHYACMHALVSLWWTNLIQSLIINTNSELSVLKFLPIEQQLVLVLVTKQKTGNYYCYCTINLLTNFFPITTSRVKWRD